MKPRHSFLLFSLLLSAHVTGCASHRPAPVAAIQPDTVHLYPGHEYTPAPGFLSGLGNVFSTPQGRADRQAVRLARAAVPRSVKVKDGAFSWGGDAVAIGKKAGPAIIKSDSATQQVATNAVAGRGNTARQTTTSTATPGPLAVLANNLTGWIPWAIGGLLVLAVVFRKRLPIVGPFFA